MATVCRIANQPGVELEVQALLNDKTSASAYRTATVAAAVTSQRSCNRSIPADRRNRSTKLASEPITPIGSMTIEIVANDRKDRSASRPSGFSRSGNGLSVIGPGARRIVKNAMTMPAPMAHANQRQRGDGRWPSGKSRRRKVTGIATIGIHIG
jgi:hypothetical protein